MLSVSESTIYRRMRSYGLSKLDFSEISDQQLDNNVSQIANDFPLWRKHDKATIAWQRY